MNEAHNIDCMTAMAQMKDNEFDLVIVDVPYGINESGQTNKTRSKLAKSKDYGNKNWDNNSPTQEYFNELIRVSKNQIIWGANHFISKIPYDSSCWIVWDKKNGENDFADCELAWTSFKTAVRKFSFQWQGMIQGYGGNKKNNEKRIHPTQKPVALYKWLLKNYAEEGWKIGDTHLGSGSSHIAAYQMGFDFVGYEIDKDYYDASVKRFEVATMQQNLFDPNEMY